MSKEIIRRLLQGRSIFIVLALLSLAGSVPVRAQQDEGATTLPPVVRGERRARRGGDDSVRLLRILNLTPEQRTQIKAIRRETEPDIRLSGMRLRQARRALDEAIYSDNPDENVVVERAREVGAAQATAVRLRALTELKIRRVLTPEQLSIFRELQKRARTRQRRNQRSPEGDSSDDAPGSFRHTVPGGASSRRPPLPHAPNAATPGERRRAILRQARPPRQ
ncbi:MAG: Spy/CpxP family protein refolding chaperone [Pyrinomonadaceae bacterium]